MSEIECFIFEDPTFAPWRGIFEAVSYRGEVGFDNGIHFIIHTAEQGHSKPHLHARYQGSEISVEIPSGAVLDGNLPKKKAKQASEWVVSNADYLKECWDALLNNGLKLNV